MLHIDRLPVFLAKCKLFNIDGFTMIAKRKTSKRKYSDIWFRFFGTLLQ